MTVESPDAALTKRAEEIVRALDLLGRARPGRSLAVGSVFKLTGLDGESIPLPEQLYEALRATAEILAAAGGATIVPIEKELTAQDAAELLGM